MCCSMDNFNWRKKTKKTNKEADNAQDEDSKKPKWRNQREQQKERKKERIVVDCEIDSNAICECVSAHSQSHESKSC